LKGISCFLCIIFFLLLPLVYSQTVNNIRFKKIKLYGNTIRIDTLSMVPNSFIVSDASGKLIDTSDYTIDYAGALLYFKNPIYTNGTISVQYRVFPLDFSKVYYHKNFSETLKKDSTDNYGLFIINKNKAPDLWGFGELNKSGSISRGISFGNNQDVFVNSSLNLQLSGKLSEEIELLAVITDQNIPVQPEGNTQQIQEFDKVFIQLSDSKTKLIAGDFEMQQPKSYFMHFQKKSQGVLLSTGLKTSKKSDSNNKTNITSGLALSKGKFSRNQISGIEGNQGPYQLSGNDNELYIIIIAGTEKVYVDGELLLRGQENDYIIDYNLAQLKFTPNRQITKDNRIVVEFEYTDINYTRTLVYVGNEWTFKKSSLIMNYYNEQDLKNQPIQRDLSLQEKKLLASIGDSLHEALTYNIDSVAFNNNQVLYKMVDTLSYDSVFVYSVHPDSAFYSLGFTNVGFGKGNYILTNSITNGRVYKWVAPVNEQPQGEYEPVILLITPKRKQMLTLSGDYYINKKTRLFIESAFSNHDVNLYSSRNKEDNNGFALKMTVSNKQKVFKKNSSDWNFITEISTEITDKRFLPIERFRSVEFDRDWNLSGQKIIENEYLSGMKLSLVDKSNKNVSYQFLYFYKGEAYKAYRNLFSLNQNYSNYYLTFDGSLLKSESINYNSDYFKQKSSLVKKIKFLSIGIKEEQEINKIRLATNNILAANSFSFFQGDVFVSNPDSSVLEYLVFYKRRYDWLPANDSLKLSTLGESYGFSTEVYNSNNSSLSLSSSYRNLMILDTLLARDEASKSLVSKVELFTSIWKEFIKTSVFYEISSGREIKKEFSYLEVAAGQGVYSWSDYNENGIKELNEFEVAVFQDKANYIRIFIPTDESIKTYSNQYNQTIAINPSAILDKKKKINKLLCRFYYSAALNIDRKLTDNNKGKAYNPFSARINDSIMVSVNSNFKNTLFFNRNSPVFGIDFNYQQSKNRILLINGFDTRYLESKGIKSRWNISKFITVFLSYQFGYKRSQSEFLKTRDYNILFSETEPTVSFQLNSIARISLIYKYTEKQNIWGMLNEKAFHHKAGTEIKYNILSKSSLSGRVNYINIAYNAQQNTSLAFEMLEGMKTGNNYTWNLSYQRSLSDNLQLNINYDGRQSEKSKTIHVGTVQLRAYF